MSDWPVGLSTGCFYRTSIFECLESIRTAGFGMIEICSFPAQLACLHFKGAFILEIAGDSDSEAVLERARRAGRFLREISRKQDVSMRKGDLG